YNQLARTPDKYVDEKVKFRGTVIQVIEGDGETQIRLAVNDDYDRVLFAAFDDSVVTSRVLENDTITIYGTSTGLITYDSTLGGKISIPGISIDKIDQ
ncbi:MAG: toxin regulator, partial [Neobacillus sp.]|nr:toxin regulator [Neobacillus sp.]